jgi:spermidine synthase
VRWREVGAAAAWIVFGLVTGAWLIGLAYGNPRLTLYQERSFFGVLRVKFDPDLKAHVLTHGTTVHGVQDPQRPDEPLGYYHRTGPIGQVFDTFKGPAAQKVGVVGLGAGTLACYCKGSDQSLTFYEIDPAVERVARDPRLFTYLDDCQKRGVELHMVLGDARLELARTPERYGLLVIDAFSSDAIPVHLLTREALELYREHLRPDGVLAFHSSSRYFNLLPVLAALARDARLDCLVREDASVSEAEKAAGKFESTWVVMAEPGHLSRLTEDPRTGKAWKPGADQPVAPVWKDDYSNVLGVFRWQQTTGGRE